MAPAPDRMHRPADVDAVVRALADLTATRVAGAPAVGPVAAPPAPPPVTVTAEGIGAERALQVWAEQLGPACIAVDHPRYLAFIPGAPTPLAGAFDMLVGASSIYGGSWMEGAGAVLAENEALRWIADLAGLPGRAGGVFVSGGTVGNLSALVAAREHARHTRPAVPGRWAVCVTEETHSSVIQVLRTVMDVDAVVVPGDDRGRMTGAALRATVDALPGEQRDGIFAVVATAGSTNLGVVDDIAGVGEIARAHGWWLHVDGAYGGAGLAAPSVRALFAGVEHADSFIVDPHKWLFSTFDCCALLYADPARGRAAHMQHADYLDALNVDEDWNPSDYAIHLSRRARGLPFWFSLAAHGTDAYRDAIEHTLAVTRAGAELVREAEHLDLVVESDLSVIVFARSGWEQADYARWSADLLRRQVGFLVPTRHRGRPCARLAVVNPLTTVDDLREIFASLR